MPVYAGWLGLDLCAIAKERPSRGPLADGILRKLSTVVGRVRWALDTVARVWDAYADFGDQDRATLSIERQRLFAILDLRQEVNSGGFDGYFRYWGGDTAQIALAALPDSLGPAWVSLLTEAMALFGPEYPNDGEAREAIMDARDLSDELEAFDARFYQLEGEVDADALLSSHGE